MQKYKLSVIIVCLAILSVTTAKAQNSSLLYYMNLPQNHLVNPAFRPLSSVYIGLPGLTGADIGLRNNFVSFSDIFFPGATGDSVISILHPDYNIDDFIAKLKTSNQIKLGATVQTFGLGFAIGRNSYFFLDINERVEGRVSLPGDLVTLFLEGNSSFAGKSIDFSSLGGNVTYFREAGFTFSTSPVKGLSIGIRPKMLMGLATATINNRDLRIDVGTDYSHTAVADLELNISGPVGVALTADNKIDSIWIEDNIDPVPFLTNTSNPGFGIDIGAKWDITDRLSISGAILDLGLIKWKDSPTNLKATSSFTFEGFDITDVIDGTRTFDQLTDELVDSLKNSFIVSDEKKAFTTYLTPTLMVGGSFNLTGSLSVGLLTRSYISAGRLRTEATLSGNANIGNSFSAVVTYSAGNASYNNLGAGFSTRGGPLQFYLMADMIPIYWDKVKFDPNVNLIFPHSWNMINLRFGVNLLFGNKSKRVEDKPMSEQPATLY